MVTRPCAGGAQQLAAAIARQEYMPPSPDRRQPDEAAMTSQYCPGEVASMNRRSKLPCGLFSGFLLSPRQVRVVLLCEFWLLGFRRIGRLRYPNGCRYLSCGFPNGLGGLHQSTFGRSLFRRLSRCVCRFLLLWHASLFYSKRSTVLGFAPHYPAAWISPVKHSHTHLPYLPGK